MREGREVEASKQQGKLSNTAHPQFPKKNELPRVGLMYMYGSLKSTVGYVVCESERGSELLSFEPTNC